MPYVLDPNEGRLVITSHGMRHEIVCRADPISQRAMVEDNTKKNGKMQPGTEVRIQWREQLDDDDADVIWPFDNLRSTEDMDDPAPLWPGTYHTFLDLARGYVFFNPHLTLTLDWFGKTVLDAKATNPAWEKWKPNRPTSPHWYEQRHLERLIGAYITHDREHDSDRTVAAFLAEFDGLTGSGKRKCVLEDTGLARVKLSALATQDNLKSDEITHLLDSMQRHTRPPKAPRLGIIGEDHFATRLKEMGGDDFSTPIDTTRWSPTQTAG